MKKQNKLGFFRKALIGLTALVAGCSSSGFVTPNLGINFPKNRWLTEFDSALTYGVRGGVKTKKGVEIEVGYRGHNTSYEDAVQRNELEANDLSIGVSYPVWSNGKVSVNVNGEVISHAEKEACWLIGIPGSELTENRSSTGFGVGVGARFQAGKGSVDARLTYEGFGEGGYEESGVRQEFGYHFSF